MPLNPSPASITPTKLRSDSGQTLEGSPASKSAMEGSPASPSPFFGDMASHGFLNKEYLIQSIKGLKRSEQMAFLRREFESFKSAFGREAGEEFLEPYAKLLYPKVKKKSKEDGVLKLVIRSFEEEQLNQREEEEGIGILGNEGRKASISDSSKTTILEKEGNDDIIATRASERNGQDGISEECLLAGISTPAAPPASSPAALQASDDGSVMGVMGGPKSHVPNTLGSPKSHVNTLPNLESQKLIGLNHLCLSL